MKPIIPPINLVHAPEPAILGRHWLIELSGCPPSILSDSKAVQSIMCHAANAAHATIVKTFFHQFSPYGISGVVVIAESHLAVHTWPEHGYAAVDFFTCSKKVDMASAYVDLIDGFKPLHYSKTEVPRGVLAEQSSEG